NELLESFHCYSKKIDIACAVSIYVAAFAAPAPAVVVVKRAVFSLPSALYWLLRMVTVSAGLLYWMPTVRALMTTELKTLNMSRRNCSWRLPPALMLRAIDRSIVWSQQPVNRFVPDSLPMLL